tara:strand:+ start:67 stop:675 length:609 start_codon:yes stop_codon:yes gene_type:complete
MNKVQTVVTAIQGMTANEIDQVLDAINFYQDLLARQHSRLFAIGDVVQFKPPQRHGRTLIGTVEKVNRKTVIVKSHGGGKWKVPSTCLVKQKKIVNCTLSDLEHDRVKLVDMLDGASDAACLAILQRLDALPVPIKDIIKLVAKKLTRVRNKHDSKTVADAASALISKWCAAYNSHGTEVSLHTAMNLHTAMTAQKSVYTQQ